MSRKRLRCGFIKICGGCTISLVVVWLLLGLHISWLEELLYFPPERTGQPISYPDGFQYLLNSEVCSPDEEPVEAVIVVHSDPRHPEIREAIRSSLPQELLTSLGLRRAFMLADASEDFTRNETTVDQAAIEEEARLHHDIVQGNFHDSYHNLTYKHVMALDWANTFCSQARMIIKMDDDILFNVYEIVHLLEKLQGRNYLGGQVFQKTAPYRGDTKWKVSWQDWPRIYYPPYLSGWFYLVSPDVSRALVLQSATVPFFWIDDTFVTGILSERLPVEITSLRNLYVTSEECVHWTSQQNLNQSQPSTARVFKPSFVIGPSGKDLETIERFNRLSIYCHKFTCHSRAPHKRCANEL